MTVKPDTDESLGAESSDFVPLTAQQAREIVRNNPSVSPWMVVFWQLLTGLVVSVLSGLVTGRQVVAVSAACGALAVVLPAALFARGVTSQFAKANVGTAVTSFFLWEFVKILVSVGVMFGAHRLVDGLSWPAMLFGLVVTIKVYWIALGYKPKVHPVQIKTLNGKSN
jgi:ATP synthase protein I